MVGGCVGWVDASIKGEKTKRCRGIIIVIHLRLRGLSSQRFPGADLSHPLSFPPSLAFKSLLGHLGRPGAVLWQLCHGFACLRIASSLVRHHSAHYTYPHPTPLPYPPYTQHTHMRLPRLLLLVATLVCDGAAVLSSKQSKPLMMVLPSSASVSSSSSSPCWTRRLPAAIATTTTKRRGIDNGDALLLAANRRRIEEQHHALSSLRTTRGGGGGTAAAAGAVSAGWATIIEGLKNGCASGLAAACAKLLLQPFDTVKTLQQANKGSLGMLEAARDMVARRGVRSLYTGLGVTLVGSIPAVSIYFGVYQAVKKALLQALPPTLGWTLLGVAASAGMGNTVASVFRVPYEVVKQRLQAGMYSSTGEALRTMYRTEGGLGAFFGSSGVASQIMRDVPYAIVTLLTYESLRRARAAARRKAGGGRCPRPSKTR